MRAVSISGFCALSDTPMRLVGYTRSRGHSISAYTSNTSSMAARLHFLTCSMGRRIQMKDICIAEQNRDLKYSLIWAGLWIVSLVALLLLPSLGR